jgi:hypothetical protein
MAAKYSSTKKKQQVNDLTKRFLEPLAKEYAAARQLVNITEQAKGYELAPNEACVKLFCSNLLSMTIGIRYAATIRADEPILVSKVRISGCGYYSVNWRNAQDLKDVKHSVNRTWLPIGADDSIRREISDKLTKELGGKYGVYENHLAFGLPGHALIGKGMGRWDGTITHEHWSPKYSHALVNEIFAAIPEEYLEFIQDQIRQKIAETKNDKLSAAQDKLSQLKEKAIADMREYILGYCKHHKVLRHMSYNDINDLFQDIGSELSLNQSVFA